MTLNRALLILTLAAATLAPAFAQGDAKPAANPASAPVAAKPAAEPAAAATEAPKEGGDGASGAGLNTDLGFDFDRLAADTIEYTPDGGLKMTGNVIFKSDQLNLESRDLVLNNETKTMVANGSPVKIKQGEVEAECRNFFYNIDKKQSRLTGSPFINQKNKDGSTTRIRGEIIIITQSASGRPSVTVQNKSGGLSEIEKVAGAGKAADAKKPGAKPAKKVTPDNPELIKLPEGEL